MGSLKSSVEKQGKIVTQIIHFRDGSKRTYEGVISASIKQGQFTKFDCEDGKMVLINDVNVNVIEVFKK